MPAATVNDIVIEYETTGSANDEAMLLIIGLGAQLVYWPPAFLRAIADRGYYVIVFDNRDVGLSTKFTTERADKGAPYTVEDMAGDAVGLLDHLHVASAHVVGVSLGGAIAQAMAIHYPSRVKTLASIMSAPGNASLPPPTPAALDALTKVAATERSAYIEQNVETAHQIGSTGFPIDDDWVRTRAARTYDRCFCPEGRTRQALAIAASPDRTDALKSVRAPTVVIHGESDPLVNVVGGKQTADAIPGATLTTIPGMGHDLPEAAWPTIIDAIVTNASRTQ